jgi:hypothetical protein
MRDMSEAERRAFLTHGTRTGKLATVRTVVDDPEAQLRWATRIGARYMGADRGDEFGRRHTAPAELLIQLPPTRVVARADIVD